MTRIRETSLALLLTMAVLAYVVAFHTGCVTTDAGGKKFDPCQAMTYAQGSHATAHGISLIVCTSITDPAKKAACLKHRQTAVTAADLLLTLGAGVLKACGL